MKNLREDCYNPVFSHIYIEKQIKNHPRTERILERFPNAEMIEIDNYKDIFNRRGQDCVRQHRYQALILAKKEPPFFYEGAPVCQDFGNTNFYYCSMIRNCIYDCDYCYLKGMYPSGHMVIFVNTEDYFSQLDEILKEKSMYLCVSYDADLLAVESLAGYGKEWVNYARRDNLAVEIRTKSANPAMWENVCLPNVIYAFTLSPQRLIEQNEKGTPSVAARIACALSGLEKGFPVRLCFDPMLYMPQWREAYGELLAELDEAFGQRNLSMQMLKDVSVGCFRISQEYMKRLKRMEPLSPTVQFPYVNEGGVYRYPKQLEAEMEEYMIAELSKRMDKEKIYHE